MSRPARLAALLVMPLLFACGSDDDGGFLMDCELPPSGTYESVEQIGVGRDARGRIIKATAFAIIDGSSWEWRLDTVTTNGQFECDSGRLMAAGSGWPPRFEVDWNPTTQELRWDGEYYRPASG